MSLKDVHFGAPLGVGTIWCAVSVFVVGVAPILVRPQVRYAVAAKGTG